MSFALLFWLIDLEIFIDIALLNLTLLLGKIDQDNLCVKNS